MGLGGLKRRIKIPQQYFALKMQGGGAYLWDTTVCNKTPLCLMVLTRSRKQRYTTQIKTCTILESLCHVTIFDQSNHSHTDGG